MTTLKILKFFRRKTFYLKKIKCFAMKKFPHFKSGHMYMNIIKKFGWGLGPPYPSPALRPWTPHALRFRTLASLVSVWIRFAKISVKVWISFAKISQVSDQFTMNVEYKSDYISKTKSHTKKTHEHKNSFHNIAHLMRQHYFSPFLVCKNNCEQNQS